MNNIGRAGCINLWKGWVLAQGESHSLLNNRTKMPSVNITEIFNLLYSKEPVSKVAMQPKGGFSYVFEPDPTCKQKEGTCSLI